jgi:hypothetical protein
MRDARERVADRTAIRLNLHVSSTPRVSAVERGRINTGDNATTTLHLRRDPSERASCTLPDVVR